MKTRLYRIFVHYTVDDERLAVNVNGDQRVGDVLSIVKDHFKLGANYGGTEARTLVLQYGGADLNQDWIFDDLNIVSGATLKCILREEKLADYSIYIRFRKELFKYYDDALDVSRFKVYELRVKLSEMFGYPLSVFRLKAEASNTEMLDEHRVIDYDVERYGKIIVETWIGWDAFLNNCIKGYSKQVIKYMSTDEIVKQYQSKVALFLAAHYGHYDLAYSMMNLGARPDRPVGEHPSRQWCSSATAPKPEYLRCPIHEAVLNGQLKIVSLFGKDSIWVLEEKDGFGIPPWRLALRNSHKDPVKNQNQKDVARFLLAKQFGAKIKISPTCHISIHFYSNLRKWIESARQKVLATYGFSKTSYKRRPFHKGALVGYRVLVDGYNNNFKDYPHAYEAYKSKYPSYYFVDEDERKERNNAETYFRTVNTVGAFNLFKLQSVSKFSKLAEGDQSKGAAAEKPKEKPKPPESKARIAWRRIINKVINRNILFRNAEAIIALGYEIEGYRPNSTKSKNSSARPKSPTASMKKAKQHSKKEGGGSNFSILAKVKQQIAKEDADESAAVIEAATVEKTKKRHKSKNQKAKKLKDSPDKLPIINEKRIKSISVNEIRQPLNQKLTSSSFKQEQKGKNTSSTSMSITSLPPIPKATTIQSSSPSLLEENSMNPLANTMKSLINEANMQFTSNQFVNSHSTFNTFNSTLSIQSETMKSYMRYCDGLTPRDIATKCLNDANAFQGKSWLKQMQIGASMVQEQTKRRLQGNFVEQRS